MTFRWEDGTTAEVPSDEVAESTLLSTALSDAEPGLEVKCSLPTGVLQQWVSGVSDEHYLLKMVKA